MTAPDVEWVLDQFGSVVASVDTDYGVTLRRVDRDNSRIYDGSNPLDMEAPIHTRKGKLEQGCYIGARSTTVSETPIGTEFNLDVERVVGVRIEGLHHGEYGHVDPDGGNGIPFHVLKRRLKQALYDKREWPAADDPAANVAFTHLSLANENDPSSDWKDFYRVDVDVVFDGFEFL